MNERPRRLTLVISSLQSGGAERVLSRMASYWAAREHEIEILSFDRPDARPFYPLHPNVRVRGLDLLRASRNPGEALWNTLTRVRRVRRAIRESRPGAVISFMNQVNVVTLLATRGLGLPVIVSERCDPARLPLARPWDRLRSWTYPSARWVVMQTEEASRFFKDPRIRTVVIPNVIAPAPAPPPRPAPQPRTSADADADTNATPWITAVGRLDPQKGFDLLLRAFARIAGAHPSWMLRIVGEGPERDALARQIRELDLESRVRLTGRIENVFPILAGTALFVLSSRFEGFPNALGEAMAAGLPVIAFDCPSGPSTMIRQGVDGVLVPCEDVGALAEAMERLIEDPPARAALAARAVEVVERFSEEAVMARWEKLLPS